VYRFEGAIDFPLFLKQCRNELGIPVRSWSPTDESTLAVECDPFDCGQIISEAQARCVSQQSTRYPALLQVSQDGRRLFEAVPSIIPVDIRYEDVSRDELEKHIRSELQVLLVTATDVELRMLRSRLKPLGGKSGLLRAPVDSFSIRLGELGMYKVAHVQCAMGGGGRHGSALTVEKAVQWIKPKAVLVIGIAFGVNPKKQRLGDVLIAESILPYELRRAGLEQTVYRGQQLPCGMVLSARFRDLSDDWNLPTHFGRASRHIGDVLSGDVLIDNPGFRDQLLAEFPTAIGGEMEGAGAYAAAQGRTVEVILLKGICDWADGYKAPYAQQFAAYAAVSLAKHVLSKPDALTEIGCSQISPRGVHPVDPSPTASAWNRLMSIFALPKTLQKKSTGAEQPDKEDTVFVLLRIDGSANDISSYLKILDQVEKVSGARVGPEVIRRGSILLELAVPEGAYEIIRALYQCGELGKLFDATVLDCRVILNEERFLAQSGRRQARFGQIKRTVVCHENSIVGFDRKRLTNPRV
jgi:nucleoside phosphorylase